MLVQVAGFFVLKIKSRLSIPSRTREEEHVYQITANSGFSRATIIKSPLRLHFAHARVRAQRILYNPDGLGHNSEVGGKGDYSYQVSRKDLRNFL